MTFPRINWFTAPPTLTLADGSVVTLDTDPTAALNQMLTNNHAGFTLEDFLSATRPQDAGSYRSPTPYWRDMLEGIAAEPDRQQRAAFVGYLYTAVVDSDLPEDARDIMAEATMLLGSYAIEAGGSPAALAQMERTWAALDLYNQRRMDEDTTNNVTFIQAYMETSGLSREDTEVELTRFAVVAGARLLQDGVPMDEFNSILSEFYFDDINVSSGTQIMLGIIYGNPGATPALPGLAADHPMRHDFEALIANSGSPTFAVDYAAFMNGYVVQYVRANPTLFTLDQLDQLLTDEQLEMYRTAVPTPSDAAIIASTAATMEASANAVPDLIGPDGTVIVPTDNGTTTLNESTMGDEIFTSWEDWTTLSTKVNEVIEQFLAFTAPQRSTALAMDPDGDGTTIRDRVEEIATTEPEAAPILAAPVVPPVTVPSPPPAVVDPGVGAPIVPSPTYANDLLSVLRLVYPDGSDTSLAVSDIFTSRAQPYNNVDGIYEDLILAVLQNQSPAQARAALSSHISDMSPGYGPDGQPLPARLDQVMAWLYPDGVTLNPQALSAVQGMLQANPELAALYQAQGILAASGITLAPTVTTATLTPDVTPTTYTGTSLSLT